MIRNSTNGNVQSAAPNFTTAMRKQAVEELTPALSASAPIFEVDVRKLRVCIFHPTEDARSETFIRQHIEGLSARSVIGGPRPTLYSDGSPLVRQGLLLKGMRKLAEDFLNLSPEFFSRGAFTRYLRRNRIEVVLAEYGPTGVEVQDCCHDAGVPLVVHFHGYDAHRLPILEEYCKGYIVVRTFASQLFGTAFTVFSERKNRALL